MDTFSNPAIMENSEMSEQDGPIQDHDFGLLRNQPMNGPRTPDVKWDIFNAHEPADESLLSRLAGAGPEWQGDSAQIVARDPSLRNRFARQRYWRPALRCTPNPFGDASRGLFDPAVVKHLTIERYFPALRKAAGQANPFGAAGGGGSNESVRIPSASTIQAF